MTSKGAVTNMREDAIRTFPGNTLPPELAAALDGGEPEAIYAVRIHKLPPKDAAEFLRVRAQVQEGLAALNAGNVYEEDEAFRMIHADN